MDKKVSLMGSKVQSIRLKLPLHLLQGIRLLHALDESDYQIHIDRKDADKIRYLKKYFPLHVRCDEGGAPLIEACRICHTEPLTAVGSLCRPLIFPQALFDRCRQMWPMRRTIPYSFAGLPTAPRARTLKQWVNTWFPEQAVPPAFTQGPTEKNPWIPKFLRSILKRRITQYGVGPVRIWFSERGRAFPVKIWDEHYYRMLANSQFVLCPNGDFIWTYRFFEAVMCGALPIIEDRCPHYEGFRFLTVSDCPDGLLWNAEDAEHNYRLCRRKLTVPGEELNRELAWMVQRHRDGEIPGILQRA